jgi:hypothetical protein
MAEDMIKFLHKHRLYRILWWEFGSTILEYLGFNAKELLVISGKNDEIVSAWGNMKAYWWWPWSCKVSEVVLSESQKEGSEKYSSYSFLYRIMLVLFTSVLTHRLVFFNIRLLINSIGVIFQGLMITTL